MKKSNNIVIINVGISGSGKSTWTKEFLKKNSNYVAVNRDSFRFMFRDTPVTENKIEDLITELQEDTIIKALNKKLNVIVDNTNLKRKYIDALCKLVEFKADVEFRIFDTPLKTCIERDAIREKKVGEDVIQKQFKDYKNLIDSFVPQNIIKRPTHEDRFIQIPHNPALRDSVIVDCDGTICLMGKRDVFDWHLVQNDDPNEVVIEQIHFHKSKGREIILVTGRDESARENTLYWLDYYKVPFDQLIMRPKNDFRKDTVVKKEIYFNYIKDKFNVIAVYDDRKSVIKMFGELGLFVFNVNVMDKIF